jgi:hypothetical protein
VGRGLNADELTRMAMAKILFVGPDVPPAIRDQAEAYRTRIEEVLRHYLAQAQRSRDTTVCNILEEAGESRAAALIRSL